MQHGLFVQRADGLQIGRGGESHWEQGSGGEDEEGEEMHLGIQESESWNLRLCLGQGVDGGGSFFVVWFYLGGAMMVDLEFAYPQALGLSCN